MTAIHDNTIMWDSSTSDVTLICEGKSFRCHREILAQNSDYFRALLQGPFIEGKSTTVELFEDNPDVLERVLKALYGFPIESAMTHYYALPGVAEYMENEDDDAVCPITRGQALVPWLRQMVDLYTTAGKYLCDSICARLMTPNYLPYAVEGLLWDFCTAGESVRPGLELVRELLAPVYEFVPNNRDPLRYQIAESVTYYQRQETVRQETLEPELELRVPGLLHAVPDLKSDLATVTLGRPDHTNREHLRRRRNELLEAAASITE